MRPLPPTVRDVCLLGARLIIGVVLVAHGVQKLGIGVGGVAGEFAGMGIPLPTVSALIMMAIELGGGVLLLLGALTPVAGLAVLAGMLGAAVFAHRSILPFAEQGGWELVGVIGALGLALAAAGPGRFSVDHALTARAHSTRETADAR